MKGDPPKSCLEYVKLFGQRTSIRGISKIEPAKFSVIKWFWSFFILCAHVIMITLLVLLVMRFFRYDTTMKISSLKTGMRDFPEVTICSKRFFEMPNSEDPAPFYYLDEYSNKVLTDISNLLNNKSITNAVNVLTNKLTTPLFFYNYYDYLMKRTTTLASRLINACNITAMDGKNNQGKKVNCSAKAIMNQNYLNCLAFSIPYTSSINTSTKFQMDIALNFALKSSEYNTENFKIDEYVADMADEEGYQVTRVYITPIADYPFDFDYEVPFNCQMNNQYIVGKSQDQLYFNPGPSATCRIDEFSVSIFGIPYTATREILCESLQLQNKIYQQCNCYIDDLPNNDSSFSVSKLCNLEATSRNCAEDEMIRIQNSVNTLCLPSCTKTSFSATYRVKPFYSSAFSENIEKFNDIIQSCDPGVENCTDVANCYLKNLYKNFPIFACSSFHTELPTTTKSSTSSTNTVSITTSPETTSEELQCESVFMKVNLRSKMQINKESLVVEVNTLLSQLGGMCAFFTGLTFTIIAEIFEIIIFWIIDKMNQNSISPC